MHVSFSGLQDSDDEDIEGDIEQQIETMMAPKRTVKDVVAIPTQPVGTIPVTDKLELAKKLASQLQSMKNLGSDNKAQLTASDVMKGGFKNVQQAKVTAKTVAERIAAKLNEEKLGYQPPEEQTGTGGVSTIIYNVSLLLVCAS